MEGDLTMNTKKHISAIKLLIAICVALLLSVTSTTISAHPYFYSYHHYRPYYRYHYYHYRPYYRPHYRYRYYRPYYHYRPYYRYRYYHPRYHYYYHTYRHWRH